VDHAFEMAVEMANLIRSDEFPNFRLVNCHPHYTNVCFYFLPDQYIQEYETEFEMSADGNMFGPKKYTHKVGTITSVLRKKMVSEGKLLMGYSTLNDYHIPNFFRFISVGRNLSKEHVRFALEHLRDLGNKLEYTF
jgi:hypothetical protein